MLRGYSPLPMRQQHRQYRALDSVGRERQPGLGSCGNAVNFCLGQHLADRDITVHIVRITSLGILRADFAIVNAGMVVESYPAFLDVDRVENLRRTVRVREARPVRFLNLHKQPAGFGLGSTVTFRDLLISTPGMILSG